MNVSKNSLFSCNLVVCISLVSFSYIFFPENFYYLKEFLSELCVPDRCRTILNWNIGGKVLLKYINICESMKQIQEVGNCLNLDTFIIFIF